MHCGNCDIDVGAVAEFGGGNDQSPTRVVVTKCPRCAATLSNGERQQAEQAVAVAPGPTVRKAQGPTPAATQMLPTTTEQIMQQARERLAYVDLELTRMAALKIEAKALRRLLRPFEPKG